MTITPAPTSPALDSPRLAELLPWLPAALARDTGQENEPTTIPLQVARLAITYHPFSTLADLFPTLPPTFDLAALKLPARQRNTLARHDLHTGADLRTVTVGALLGTWAVGPVGVELILTALAGVVVDA